MVPIWFDNDDTMQQLVDHDASCIRCRCSCQCPPVNKELFATSRHKAAPNHRPVVNLPVFETPEATTWRVATSEHRTGCSLTALQVVPTTAQCELYSATNNDAHTHPTEHGSHSLLGLIIMSFAPSFYRTNQRDACPNAVGVMQVEILSIDIISSKEPVMHACSI